MNRAASWAIALSLFLGGCIAPDAISRNYDLGKVRRIGVMSFNYGRYDDFGAEDIFAKHLLDRGYQVVERARLEAILKEQKLSAAGVFAPETTKGVGKLLGVDAVLLGQVNAYEPQRKTLITLESFATREEPVYEKRKEKQPDGSFVEANHLIGKKVTRERKAIPTLLPIDAEVAIAVKLVDVESGEVVWIGSDTGQGLNAALAVEWIAQYLVKRLAKKWRPAGS